MTSSSRDRRPARRLVAVTYNVCRCTGPDGRRDPGRVARVIRATGADVVGLQEVDSESRHETFADQLEDLARATGMRGVAGPTLRRDGGGYGNGLLTRLPVARVGRHDLSVTGFEPRGALEVDVVLGDGEVKLVITHLGLRRAERRRQAARLIEWLGARMRDAPDGALVLMGDFNESWPVDATCRRLDRLLGSTPTRRTFPSRFPLLALDRIWVASGCRLRELRAVRDAPAREASDHLPLRAVIDCG